MQHTFKSLYQANRLKSARPFLARGSHIERCEACMLSLTACICAWRNPLQDLSFDWIVLFHHDEIFKPTNTGRLIGDIFPGHTYAFEWSRTQPHPDLLDLLTDVNRIPCILFPGDPKIDLTAVLTCDSAWPKALQKRLTLVVLDGTWRQASRMFRSSAWLQSYPCLSIDSEIQSSYAVRQAIRAGQLSTAEAACQALTLLNHAQAAQHLLDYFKVFNQHCLATRRSHKPLETDEHRRLSNI